VIQIPADLVVRIPDFASDELCVVYEDDDLLAVDKPPFVSVHPSGRHMSDSLIHRVHVRYRERIAELGWAPKLCHRLDRETSGIVLCAKDAEVHRRVMRAFEQREVEKHYLALVRGVPRQPSGVIDMALGPARASRIGLKMACVVDGVPARTDWELIEARGDISLIRCRLHTGRQHQIRVHMAAIGHPVVGDKLYGDDDELFQRGVEGELSASDFEELELPRHALHNHRLAFDHPRSGERVVVESPLSADLTAFFAECGG
jgi:23S rRNA pseudouridine1911/1915/1917 synthase